MARPSAPVAKAPTAKTSAPRRQAARSRIDDEHRQLGELLMSLVHTHDLHRVDKLLGDLHTLLVHHFEGEEGAQGLHSVVGEGASHRLPNLQHLFDEHREFLARLERSAGGDRRGARRSGEEIAEGIHHLAESLRRHEAEEERLFGEAFYTDLGGRSS